jgi:hypothetical protein
MKSLLLPVLMLCTLSTLTGCKLRRQEAALAATQATKPQPFLLFEKTRCFGSCPSYQASIAEDGSITFIGRAYVPVEDTVHLQLPAPTLKELQETVKQLNYEQLEDIYPTQWSDMPSTITTFYKDGNLAKRIKHQEGGPEALKLFQNRLNSILLDLAAAEANKHLPEK